MTALLLASYLASQTWSWVPNAEPDVVAYRVYWGASGTAWCAANRVEFPASVCTATECQGEIPEPPWSPAFITVVAVDSAGLESAPPDHGQVVTCP